MSISFIQSRIDALTTGLFPPESPVVLIQIQQSIIYIKSLLGQYDVSNEHALNAMNDIQQQAVIYHSLASLLELKAINVTHDIVAQGLHNNATNYAHDESKHYRELAKIYKENFDNLHHHFSPAFHYIDHW